ncbi:MAG: transposase [Elusimicrobiota bacterium]
MPRIPRVHASGQAFHVVSRGNKGADIFTDRAEWAAFLDTLAAVKGRWPFHLHAYCLMPNHFHLLLRVFDTPLPFLMQRVLYAHARAFNLSRGVVGHVFQGRHKAILVRDDPQFLATLRYIHLNPVRAEIAETPERWPWSGHLELMGRSSRDLLDTAFPLALFSPDIAVARREYRDFLMPDREESTPMTTPSTDASSPPSEPVQPSIGGEPLPTLVSRIARGTGVSAESIVGSTRRRVVVLARKDFVREAVRQGHSWTDLARFLNRTPSGVFRLSEA